MMKHPRRNAWLAAFLAVVLMAGSVYGAFVFGYQKPKIVLDETEKKEEKAEGAIESAGGGDAPTWAKLSSTMTYFCGEEAEKANKAIISLQPMSNGVHMSVKNDSDSPISQLNEGDIFFLEGDKNNPFGETYIGKVDDKNVHDAQTDYLVTTPGIDEVFDELHLDVDTGEIPLDEVYLMESVEGVTLEKHVDLAKEFADMEDLEPVNISEDEYNSFGQVAGAVNMSYQNGVKLVSNNKETKSGETESSVSKMVEAGEDSLLLKINCDLLKVFGLDEKTLIKEKKANRACSITQSADEKVYLSRTGNCYHMDGCHYLKKSVPLSSKEVALDYAIGKGYTPCSYCNPPVIQESLKPKLDLKIKLGLEDLRAGTKFDWEGFSVQNLKVSVDGKLVGEGGLEIGSQLKFDTENTEMEVAGVKFQGLKNKMFPVAFLGYNFAEPVALVFPMNKTIRSHTEKLPITIAFVVYVDISGNVELKAEYTLNASLKFSYMNQACENGEWIRHSEGETKPEIFWRFSTEAMGDADAHVGVSAMVYVFNLNVVELAIAKVGAEAEGKFKIQVTSKDIKSGKNLWDNMEANYFARMYLKMGEIHINLSIKPILFGFGGAIKYDHTFIDKTLASWGEKPDTYCSFGQMSYGNITAIDKTAHCYYFKNEKGQLQKIDKDGQTTLCTEEFISICGIDTAYIYIFRNGEEGKEICRVSRQNGNVRKIVSGVSRPLMMDDVYLYYIPEFNTSSIERINRGSLSQVSFSNFSKHVEAMVKQESGYYVVTRDNGILSLIFGTSSYYYLVDKDGEIINDFGSSPRLTEYPCFYQEGKEPYYAVQEMAVGGVLRNLVTGVHWLSLDKSQSKKIPTASGWNVSPMGIMSVMEKEGGDGCHLLCTDPSTGNDFILTELETPGAIYTLTKDKGYWYYFDKKGENMVLYQCKEDFSEKKEIKILDNEVLPANLDLSKCSVEILENTLFFYQMPNDSQLNVLYRYSF